MSSTPPQTRRFTTATLLGAAVLTLAGCGNNEAVTSRPAAVDAVEYVEQFYIDVLTNKDGICSSFTDAGRADFVVDMAPATSCEEAADVLGNSVGEHVEEFTSDHIYTVDSETADAVVVRADFGNFADLMTVHWTGGRWMSGTTERVASTQVLAPEGDHGTSDGDGYVH